MCDDGSPALTNNRWMRYLFRLADIDNIVNDVASIFLKGIVHRTIERAPRAVIVDSKPPSHVDELHRMPHLRQLRIEPCAFAHSSLDYADIRDLRSNVEMDQHQRVGHTLA